MSNPFWNPRREDKLPRKLKKRLRHIIAMERFNALFEKLYTPRIVEGLVYPSPLFTLLGVES